MWLYWLWNSDKSVGQNLAAAARVVVAPLFCWIPGFVLKEIGAPVPVTVLAFAVCFGLAGWWIIRQYSAHLESRPADEGDRG